jgi:hypothetical protein
MLSALPLVMRTSSSRTRGVTLLGAAGIFAIAACSATGCYAHVAPEPVGYAEVTAAPVDIETYPSVVYDGQPVYFYGDRWWRRDGGRWTYYHDEPAELYRRRGVVLRSPRARVRVRTAPVREERR